jgi:hypothetical protein
MKKVILIFLLFVGTLFMFFPNKTKANGENGSEIKTEKINPGSFYYNFKRLGEKIRTILYILPEKKVSYKLRLLEKRVSEVNYVTEKKMYGHVETSTGRLSFYAGDIVENIENSKITTLKSEIKSNFEAYAVFLEKSRDRFPANTSNWLLVQQDIDALRINASKL